MESPACQRRLRISTKPISRAGGGIDQFSCIFRNFLAFFRLFSPFCLFFGMSFEIEGAISLKNRSTSAIFMLHICAPYTKNPVICATASHNINKRTNQTEQVFLYSWYGSGLGIWIWLCNMVWPQIIPQPVADPEPVPDEPPPAYHESLRAPYEPPLPAYSEDDSMLEPPPYNELL